MAKRNHSKPDAEKKSAAKHEAQMKKIKRIAIIIGAVALVTAAFFVYSYFFGNPVTKISAKNKIEAHIAQKFPNFDLALSPLKYDRETGAFYTTASSDTEEDVHFAVYCKSGVCNDYYTDAVENLFNTIERFEKAFSDTAKTALSKANILSQLNEVYVSAASFFDARDSGEFKINMPVTTNLETDFAVHVTAQGTATVEGLAKTITAMHAELEKADLPDIVRYSVTLTDGEKTAKAYNVAATDVAAGELEKVLQNALDNPFDAFNDLKNENPLTVSIQ